MRGAGGHRDLLALEQFRPHVVQSEVAAGHEARRRAIIRVAEISKFAGLRRDGNRGHHRIAAVVGERRQQRVEPPHLHCAGDFQLLADHPRQIDVEAGRIAVGPRIVERRIVDFGDEADQRDARKVRPLRPPSRVPKSRDGDRSRRGGIAGRRQPLGRCRTDAQPYSQHGACSYDRPQWAVSAEFHL